MKPVGLVLRAGGGIPIIAEAQGGWRSIWRA